MHKTLLKETSVKPFSAAALALALLFTASYSYAQDIVYCEVDYNIVNDWGAGFQVDVVVTNTATEAIEGYTLEWNMVETLDYGWNATYQQSGTTVTASNSASQWNGTIQPGQSVDFGFQAANPDPPADVPEEFTLNGIRCNPDDLPPSSSSSSSSSSSGGIDMTIGNAAPVCPGSSDGEVIGQDPDNEDFVLFNPDDFEGSLVYFREYGVGGGPVHSTSAGIRYANGSDFNRPMRLIDRSDSSVVIEQIDFPPSGGWDTWSSVAFDRTLTGQLNLISLSPEGGPNLRSIGSTVNLTGCYTGVGCGGSASDGTCPDTDNGSSSSSGSSSSNSSSSSSSSSTSSSSSRSSTSSFSSSLSSSSSSSSSSSDDTGECAEVISGGQSGSFNTSGPYCFRTQDAVNGWGVSNFSGRTISVTVNGEGTAVTTPGAPLPAKGPDDYYHFSASGGDLAWASVYWW